MRAPRFDRILVAVDDSPASLAAVHEAVALAALGGGVLRFVHVIADGELVRGLARMGRGEELEATRSDASTSLLRHVGGEAHHAGVAAETVSLVGEPAGLVLAQVQVWDADLVVMGRSDVRGAGRPYVGAVAREVLEFSEVPVLVVPAT